MKRNSRLALALHTMGHMALRPDLKRTSAEIAAHAGTNPVVVRRVLGRLRDAGLLRSETGPSGGWQLAKPAEDITMADVYVALDERFVAATEVADAPRCAIEQALHQRVATVLLDVEETLIQRLSETTIAEVRLA